MKEESKRKIGEQISNFTKFSLGGCGFLIILGIMIGPLFLFSNLNPTNKSNNVMTCQIDISLTFVENGVFNNYTLFYNSQADSINNRTISINNVPLDQTQDVKMPNISDSNWLLAFPHIKSIKNYLDAGKNIEIYIALTYSFIRPYPSNSQKAWNNLLYPILTPSIKRDQIIKNITDNLNDCNSEPILLQQFYKPGIHLTVDSKAKVLEQFNNISYDTELKLHCSNTTKGDDIDYSRSYFSFSLANKTLAGEKNGIVFYVFSDLVSETTASFDVLGFYISFVLVVGNLIRNVISGEETRIILTEMPEPESIITLCEGIKISRYKRDFIKEEYLYYVLIDLMRSPEIIKIITKSSIKKLREKMDREDNQ